VWFGEFQQFGVICTPAGAEVKGAREWDVAFRRSVGFIRKIAAVEVD